MPRNKRLSYIHRKYLRENAPPKRAKRRSRMLRIDEIAQIKTMIFLRYDRNLIAAKFGKTRQAINYIAKKFYFAK